MIPRDRQGGHQNSRATAGATHGKSTATFLVKVRRLWVVLLPRPTWILPLHCGCIPNRRGCPDPSSSPLWWTHVTAERLCGLILECLWTHMPGSPMVRAKDTKWDQSGQTHLLTWIIRWALHVWCWRLSPWIPVGGTARPEACWFWRDSYNFLKLVAYAPVSSCSVPCFVLLPAKDGAKWSTELPASSPLPACLGDGEVSL